MLGSLPKANIRALTFGRARSNLTVSSLRSFHVVKASYVAHSARPNFIFFCLRSALVVPSCIWWVLEPSLRILVRSNVDVSVLRSNFTVSRLLTSHTRQDQILSVVILRSTSIVVSIIWWVLELSLLVLVGSNFAIPILRSYFILLKLLLSHTWQDHILSFIFLRSHLTVLSFILRVHIGALTFDSTKVAFYSILRSSHVTEASYATHSAGPHFIFFLLEVTSHRASFDSSSKHQVVHS